METIEDPDQDKCPLTIRGPWDIMSRELLNSLNKSTNYEFRAQKITSYSL